MNMFLLPDEITFRRSFIELDALHIYVLVVKYSLRNKEKTTKLLESKQMFCDLLTEMKNQLPL